MREIKPGDWVKIINDRHYCDNITRGRFYTVVEVLNSGAGDIVVMDDDGKKTVPYECIYELVEVMDEQPFEINTEET